MFKEIFEIDTTEIARTELDFRDVPNLMKYKRIIDEFIEKKRHELHLLKLGSNKPKSENRADSY